MKRSKRVTSNEPIAAIWELLSSGNTAYRAAGILLLKEYATTLTANGKGAYASKLVQAFKDADPRRGLRPKDRRNTLVP